MINVTDNVSSVLAYTQRLLGQHQAEVVRALNTTALAGRTAVQREMDRVFTPAPTPYIRRSVWVDLAKPGRMQAVVRIRELGGKGVDPNKVLQAQVYGGRRGAKRSERAFQRAGLLPAGFAMVPQSGAPVDQYGNVPGNFLVQLISYFKAFGEVGYKANMSDRRRQALAKVGTSEGGFRRINGVQYFIARGFGNTAHLQPGIYAKRGIHGSDISCIFLFVRMPVYQRRLNFHEVVGSQVRAFFQRDLEANLAKAKARAQ